MSLALTARERRLARSYRKMMRRARQRAPQPVRQMASYSPRRVSTRAHKAAIAQLFCVATAIRYGLEKGGVQVAHIRFSTAAHAKTNPGLQQKPHDRWTIPLCSEEHRRQHMGSERQYWDELGVDPHRIAEALWNASPDLDAMRIALQSHCAKAANIRRAPAH